MIFIVELEKVNQKEVYILNDNDQIKGKDPETCEGTSKPVFKCGDCNETFEKNMTLNKHISTKHTELKNKSEGLNYIV